MMRQQLPHLLGALLLAPCLHAATYKLDLADNGVTRRVAAGEEITLTLTHRLPAAGYTVSIERAGLLTPFDLGSFDTSETARDRVAETDTCRGVVDEFTRADDETALRAEFAAQRAKRPECSDAIDAYEKFTKRAFEGTYTLSEGQRLEVTISRGPVGSRGEQRTWRFVFNTTQGRQWLVHYGFAYVPDRDDAFFTESTMDGDGFVIREANDRTDLQFEPTVAFTFVPRGGLEKPAIPKFTAGLGVNIFDEPLVFGGASWIIGDNVSVFAGAAVHRQTRLAGRYEVGQMVGEVLSGDQLTEETFGINGIIGIGFRFGSNPFKNRNAEVMSAAAASAGGPDANATVTGNGRNGSDSLPGSNGSANGGGRGEGDGR